MNLKQKPVKWSLAEGKVDPKKEHIEISCGNALTSKYDSWQHVVLIGKPENNIFPVTWLLDPENAEHKSIIDAARKDMNLILIEKQELNPWGYACYHCNTAVNISSKTHWSHFPNGQHKKAVSRDR